MALGIKDVARGTLGPGAAGNGLQFRVVDVALDTSYPAGGSPLAAADVGLTQILLVLPQPMDPVFGNALFYDHATGKLKVVFGNHSHTENTAGAYVQNATTANQSVPTTSERSAGNNFSTATVRVLILGV